MPNGDKYDDGADMKEVVDDLACMLRSGAVRLPELKLLQINGLCGEGMYGGPDRALLASLPPTAQLWWMAERPHHVGRPPLSSKWQELARAADLRWHYGEFSVLSWLSSQLPFFPHSHKGYHAVYELLLEHGASDEPTPCSYFHDEAHKPLMLHPREIYRRMRHDPTMRDQYGTQFTYGEADEGEVNAYPNGTEISDYEDTDEDAIDEEP